MDPIEKANVIQNSKLFDELPLEDITRFTNIVK